MLLPIREAKWLAERLFSFGTSTRARDLKIVAMHRMKFQDWLPNDDRSSIDAMLVGQRKVRLSIHVKICKRTSK
jgi:hypothetical protein